MSTHTPQKPSSNPLSTFYFTNFLTSWDKKTMLEVFKRYGNAISVYIAGKRNKDGKRFGFCRFAGVSDHASFEHILTGKKSLNPISIPTIQLKLPSAPTYCSINSIFAELKNIEGASSTHHLLLDLGFEDC
ncbi:cytochrome P450 [Tanacetum coccineum]